MKLLEQPNRAGVVTRILTDLLDTARKIRVSDVRIGLGYTAVMLEDGELGVAYTFRDQARGGCSVFHGVLPLADSLASDLLVLLESQDPIEAGVGLACANALANHGGDYLDGDVLDQLDLRPDDRVGMVGNFGPLVGPLQQRARSLSIFERIERAAGLLRPQAEAVTALPRCQVVLLTATSIINHTLDSLLKATRGCREVVLLGASTPLLKDSFSRSQVTMLCGVVVQKPKLVLRAVSEGGGMRQFSPHVRKVTMRVTSPETNSKRSER